MAAHLPSVETMSNISAQTGAVPARAAEWIVRILREAGLPASGPMLLAMENNSQLDLRLLNVKQLKRTSHEMSIRTIRFHNNNISESKSLIFFPPKSGARKAEWVTAIATFFFHGNDLNNNVINILNGTATSLASAAPAKKSSPTRASAKKPSPTTGASKSPVSRKSPSKAIPSRPTTSLASAKKQSTAKAIKKSTVRKCPPNAKAKMTKKSPTAKSKSAIAADAAMARSLQNQYMQEDMGHFMTQGNPIMGGIGHQAWGGPLANSYLENHIGNGATASYGSASGSDPAAGLKMPANCNDSTKPKHVLAKVKKEPLSHTSSSYTTHSNATASSAVPATDEYLLQPHGLRESNMVANLRDMGFTNTQEILTALRAVAAEREEISIVSAPPNGMSGLSSTGWSTEEQVETAMMWIVSQREEAAEAQKLDEARISSEQADAAMEQSRRQDMKQELKNADLVDLIGSVEEDDSVEIRSRHFPCSVLLRNRSVKTVLKAIASGESLGKEQVIRLLSLEKKARKWYGTVLPFSFFMYVLCPRFESCTQEVLRTARSIICQRLSHESDELEKAMFNLSEQEEGGVGSVPKVFLAAQRDASEKGKPTSSEDTKVGNDDDVQVLQHSSRVGRSLSAMGDAGSRKLSVEVIEIT